MLRSSSCARTRTTSLGAVTGTIRLATAEDAGTIASLIVEAFEEYRAWLVPPSAALLETAMTIEASLAGSCSAALAYVHEAAAGCVLFEPRGEDLYFGRLAVLPKYRQTGLARTLVAFVEEEASRRGCAGVLLSVRVALPANQQLFARLGYVEVGRHAHAGYDAPTWIDMRKPV